MKNLCSCDAARLEDELIQLRESTRLALKSSWDEVEILQNTNSFQAGTISNLTTEMTKLKEELNTARAREKNLLRSNDKLISKLAASRKTPLFKSSKISPSPVTVTASTLSKVLNLDNRSQEMEKESISDDEKDVKIEELKFKLKSRDGIINSMEETMTVHIQNMQQLRVACDA